MYLEVYPDIIFILNFLLDFLLLYLLKKVNRKDTSIPKLIGAAACGAVFAVIIGIFPWLNIIIRFLMINVFASILMILIAFGKLQRLDFIKQVIGLYLITYFVGGFINSVYYYTDLRANILRISNYLIFSSISAKFIFIIMVFLIPIVLIMVRILRFHLGKEKTLFDVELVLNHRSIHTKGLLDTGNCLYDPVFRRPVMVMDNTLTRELLSMEFLNDLEKAKKYMVSSGADNGEWDIDREHLVRLRMIPYQSIGRSQGMMMGLMLDKVLINTGKETICNEKVTAALCDNQLSPKEEYHVILHKELI